MLFEVKWQEYWIIIENYSKNYNVPFVTRNCDTESYNHLLQNDCNFQYNNRTISIVTIGSVIIFEIILLDYPSIFLLFHLKQHYSIFWLKPDPLTVKLQMEITLDFQNISGNSYFILWLFRDWILLFYFFVHLKILPVEWL